MKLRHHILSLTPNPVVLLAHDLRCLWRYRVISQNLVSQRISAKSTVIVAPHPDDETFGCGGLIQLKRAAGIPVRVLLLTDGEAVSNGTGEPAATIIAARRHEFIQACQRLGLQADALRWLHLPDGQLPRSDQPGFPAATQALAAEIAAFAPEEIFCPHLLDVRPDHIAASQLTGAALRQSGRAAAMFYYPVWMWYHASSGLRQRLNCHKAWRLDITSALPAKRAAMAAYLDAPRKTSAGHPFCGRLPWSFLRNFRRRYEVFFPSLAGDGSQE